LVDDGTFNVNGGSTTITSLSGSGSVALDKNTVLTLSKASDVFSGVISGGNSSSGLTIAGGSETLTGANTYKGTTTINTGATLILSGSGKITTPVSDSGTFDIRGTNSVGATTVNGGATPTAVLTGKGTLTSNVSNNGIVRPFDTVSNKAAAFTINGTYSQGSSGAFDIAISGLTSYSQLHVTGKATLGASANLDVDTYNSFILPVGMTTFNDVLDYASGSTGDFTNLDYNGASCTSHVADTWVCGTHLTFSLTTGLTRNLIVVRTPEPGTIGLLASGVLGLFGLQRLKRKRRSAASR
jgi:hypothetical protein